MTTDERLLYAVGIGTTRLVPHDRFPFPCTLARAREFAAASTGVVLVRRPVIPIRIFRADGSMVHSGSPESGLRDRPRSLERMLSRRDLMLGACGYVEFETFEVYASPPRR